MSFANEERSTADVVRGTLPVQVREWGVEEFMSSAAEWQELLGRSDADPLFMSWAWQSSWWRHHAEAVNGKLLLLAAYAPDGTLIGLAPFHLRRARHRASLNAMRLESLGSTWRHNATVFSEYLDFIVDRDYVDAFLPALAQTLLDDDRWSDLVIANSRLDAVANRLVAEYLENSCYVRRVDALSAHLTALPDQFKQYLDNLHASTRRKLWNHRSKLQQPQIQYCDGGGVGDFLDEMDAFHQARWGVPHFVGRRRSFHLEFATAMAQQGSLRMSRLVAGQRTLSLLYDIRLGATEYNMQIGFDQTALRSASPGYLHFGFCLEHACAAGVRQFDFLAGTGRHRDYKHDFLTQETALVTTQAIRSRPLAWLYKEYDRHYGPVVASAGPFMVSADLGGLINLQDTLF